MSTKTKSIVAAIASILVLVAAAVAIPFTPVMPVKDIQVEGNRALSVEHVESLSGIERGTPMGRVNAHQAAVHVASDPWVKTVTVSRNWPNAIAVELEEHVAVAYTNQSDGAHLIDREGREFLVAEPPADAVELVGAPVGDDAAMADVVDIATSLSDQARGEIASIEVGPYNHILHTRDDRTVYWGASEDNENKALALETVLQMEGTEFNIANPRLVTSR